MELNKMTVHQMLPNIRRSISGQYLMWNICMGDSITW